MDEMPCLYCLNPIKAGLHSLQHKGGPNRTNLAYIASQRYTYRYTDSRIVSGAQDRGKGNEQLE